MTESHFSVYTDGGSRGNPGPAAYGYVIYAPSGELVAQGSRYIGPTTNNQAEYQGIVAALEALNEMAVAQSVTCFLDSQLVVRQINGIYKMKHPDLKPWLDKINQLRATIKFPLSFVDVPRSENKYADALVNAALDTYLAEHNRG
jgi:ribonuclease H / adenosylcobalamin/alpha-ribazole phosphatase